jgi:lipopolysaccharide export system permease protein
VVIIVSREFIRVLDKAVQGSVSSETLLTLLALKTVTIGVPLLPAALFMAVLMVIGNLYRDQEMAAIASAGGGIVTVYRAVLWAVLPLSLCGAGAALYATPWAEATATTLMQHDAEASDLRGIAAGKFSEYSQSDLVFYVASIDTNKVMHNVFVQLRNAKMPSIINAESARIQSLAEGRYIVFNNGERVQGGAGTLNFTLEKFAQYAVRVEAPETHLVFNRPAMAVATLWQSTLPIDQAELQRRMAVPLGMLLLMLLAVPLAQVSPRQGAFGSLLIGFLIYFSYANILRISQLGVGKASIPAWLGLAGVHGILLIIAAVLIIRLYGWRWYWHIIRRYLAR